MPHSGGKEKIMLLFQIISLTVPFVLVLATVLYSINRVRNGLSPKSALTRQLACFACILALSSVCTFAVAATEEQATPEQSEATQESSSDISDGLGFIAAALVTGISGIGGGMAVAAAAPAAIGATSEDPKAFGKALIFVALGEGIALYGLLVSILILNKI